ncbi:MAG: histidine--tRNA ligase, partial [Firmicutes bacterium]|nr:histidine--tRNA ligase [Bacillota bacterium]
MPIVKPRTLSGFMELLPPEQIQFERMAQVLRETYASFGFTPLDTPLLEAADILLAKGGGETEKQIYRFTRGDSELALRFDLTVPLAKYVALHCGELSFPFRRYQIGKVYRGERAQRGRYRELYQADVDIVGDGRLDIAAEAEIPAVIYYAFTALGLRRFRIKINNRKLLNGFFEILGLSERAGDLMRLLDKRDKLDAAALSGLLRVSDIPEKAAFEILSLTPAALERYAGKNALFDEGLTELRTVTRYLPEFGVPETHFMIDPALIRGLDYYTGTVYETVMADYPEIGSICGGGRYDNLAGYYTDKQLPGVGISIGLTRLFYILNEQGLLSNELVTAPCDALMLPMTDGIEAAIRVAAILRGR